MRKIHDYAGEKSCFSRAEQVHLLGKVTEAEVFEQFLQTKFLGAKRFSLEGAESTIPIRTLRYARASPEFRACEKRKSRETAL
jgi:2-oxoglutarate dehydrogenase complex dehydrogenase (E1) component-like enzyme